VTIVFNNRIYQTGQSVTYKAKKAKSGKAK
jgi:hypothetical protein